MSNNTEFWGKRFGVLHPMYGKIFRYKRPALSGNGNSGKAKPKKVSFQSKAQKAAHIKMMQKAGLPQIIYNSKGRKIGKSHAISEYL